MNASILVLSLASVAAAPQDVLYDFYSTSCGPCQMMMPVVERLHAEGYPVVKINIGERPDLATRFGISVVPTFVLVVGGQVQQSLCGMQEESTLQDHARTNSPQRALAPPDRPARVRTIVARSPGRRRDQAEMEFQSAPAPVLVQLVQEHGHGPSRCAERGSPIPGRFGHGALADNTGNPTAVCPSAQRRERRRATDVKICRWTRGVAGPDSVVRGAAPRYSNEPEASPDPASVPMLASSARIRVTDEGGVYYGSGVVIDGTAGKSIVLTCGHILRDVKPESQIEVDLFEGKNFHTYRGSIVKFNLDADVGLVMLQTTSNVTASPVAAADDKVVRGQGLLSIGCSRGELPSIERLQVTMLNRYEGPDTIECNGVPVKGRSGGGLFTMNGQVVGVCTNADPNEGKGVYAGLKPIHKLLRCGWIGRPDPRLASDSRTNGRRRRRARRQLLARRGAGPRQARAGIGPDETSPRQTHRSRSTGRGARDPCGGRGRSRNGRRRGDLHHSTYSSHGEQ